MSERRFQLVPYIPQGAATHTVPTCRRLESSTPSLAGFIRGGGSLRSVPLGQTYTVPAPTTDEEEAMPLMSDRKIAAAMMKTANRQSRITLCAVFVALGISIAVFTGLGVVIWRVNANMENVENAIAPHAREVVNATLDMMHDLGGSFHNMHEISDYTNELVHVTAGATGPAAATINSTALIAQKLAEFMQHPTIQLSLGNLGNGGR